MDYFLFVGGIIIIIIEFIFFLVFIFFLKKGTMYHTLSLREYRGRLPYGTYNIYVIF